MKNKGFTLLELLGVVIILGVLALITFPIILNQVKNANEGIKDSTRVLIIDAAKDYYEDNTNNYDKIEGMTYCINISTLTDNNYLNKNIKNENLNSIDTNKKVKMIYHNGKFDYDVVDSCNNNSLTRNNIEIPIVSENSGLYKSTTDKDRFIYRGGTPNNFIELNEGTDQNPNYVEYRIISFENDGTIKVVRNESIGEFAWDEAGNRNSSVDTYCSGASSYGCNVWSNQDSTLYGDRSLTDLNQSFFYKYYSDNDSLLQNSSNTGNVLKESSLNIFLNHLDDDADYWESFDILSKYVDFHSFKVGGIYYHQEYPMSDAKSLSREKEEQNVYTWNGKIGLMNVTDYVESSLNSNCTSVYSNFYYNSNYYYDMNDSGRKTQNLSGYDNWPCSNRNYNWLADEITEWFLSVYSRTRTSSWSIDSNGYFVYGLLSDSLNVRPAFYLKSSISLIGEGTEESPYRIVGEV